MNTITPMRPKRTRGNPTEDGEFVVFEHVPIFDEHEGDDGVVYDERLLRAIADNCNRRIQTTGDWCPAVVAHTRDREDKATVDDDPQVIGLCGPFYVADFTNGDGRQVKAIHCHFWIFPEEEKTFLRNPRRSVEIWPEERPEDRYFDPIALLGAETPKRDLGMIYSRRRPGREPSRRCMAGPLRYAKRSTKPLRYEEGGGVASTPGGNNTFIPGAVEIPKKKKPLQHAKGSSPMALSPDDISQIVEALRPTIESIVDERMGPADLGNDADLGAAPDLGGAPDMGGADLGGAPGGDMDDVPNYDDMDEESKLYSRGLGRKYMRYKKDEGWDEDGESSFMATLDDDDKGKLGSYMKYMCDDDDSKKRYAERYAKSPIGGTDLTESGPMATGEMKDGEPTRYGKGMPMNYQKLRQERDEAAAKYSKLNREHQELKQRYAKQEGELATVRQKERYSRRLSQLKDLEPEYAFDAEEEMSLTEDFSDDQFTRHLDVIKTRYAKVSGQTMPTERERPLPSPAQEKQQRYAKQATDLVQRYRKAGRSIDYGKLLDHLIENHGQVNEDKLFQSNGHAAA